MAEGCSGAPCALTCLGEYTVRVYGRHPNPLRGEREMHECPSMCVVGQLEGCALKRGRAAASTEAERTRPTRGIEGWRLVVAEVEQMEHCGLASSA